MKRQSLARTSRKNTHNQEATWQIWTLLQPPTAACSAPAKYMTCILSLSLPEPSLLRAHFIGIALIKNISSRYKYNTPTYITMSYYVSSCVCVLLYVCVSVMGGREERAEREEERKKWGERKKSKNKSFETCLLWKNT